MDRKPIRKPNHREQKTNPVTFPQVDAEAIPFLTAVGGWIVGIFSARFLQRTKATSDRAWELHKLITEVRTGNYAAERLKRARDVRNLSALLPRRLEKHTERVLAIWQQMADIENKPGRRGYDKPALDAEKKALEKLADAEIATLLPRLKRRAK
jgi:hypothetical protein